MSHEVSETIERHDGRWVNVYGKGLPKAGQQLPGTSDFGSVDEAVTAAKSRSESFNHGPSADEIEQSLNGDMRYQMLTGTDRVLKRKQVYDKLGVEPPTSISSPGKKELNEDGPVHKYVRPALELGGMMAGGVAGAPLGPVGAVGGGALGYAGGDALASLIERIAGERPPIQSVEQAIGETGRSIGTGAALEMGAGIVGKAVGTVASKALAPFRSQYEGEGKALDELARSKGITLDPHEVSQSMPLALTHKTLEKLPFTSGMIQRNEAKKLEDLTKEWTRLRDQTGTGQRQRLGDVGQKIQDTVEKELDRLGMRQGEIRDAAREQILQQVGSPVSYKDLGAQSQKALLDHHQGLKDVENTAWEYARAGVPDGRVVTSDLPKAAAEIKKSYENIPSFLDEPLLKQLSDVAGSGNRKYDAALKAAQESVPEGLPAAMRNKIIKESVGAEQPGWRVDDLLKLRSELSSNIQAHHTGLQRGDAAKGSADAYGRVYTQLLKAVDSDLAKFGEAQGSDVAQRFALARAASGQRLSFFNPKDNPAVAKAITSDPAHLASVLIKPGSASGFTSLKDLVGVNATAPVKQSFTNQLLNVGGKEADGLPGLRQRLDRYGLQTIKEVYSPQEVKDLYHLADQSSWMAKSPIGNPFFREIVKTRPREVAPTILGHADLTAKTLRKFPQMRGHLRSAFVEGMKPAEQILPNGTTRELFPTQMLKHLNAYPADVQKQLFSQAEIRDFYDLARIVERTKGAVKMGENPSGTAQQLITFEAGKAILRNPLTGVPAAMGTNALGKLYLSKTGRRFLLEGLVTPTNNSRSAYITSQILGVAGVDAVADADEQQRRGREPQLEQGAP